MWMRVYRGECMRGWLDCPSAACQVRERGETATAVIDQHVLQCSTFLLSYCGRGYVRQCYSIAIVGDSEHVRPLKPSV